MLIMGFTTSALGIGIQTNGDIRFLGEMVGNQSLNTTPGLVNAAQMTLRALLRPKVFITDQFVLVSEWSFLEPAYDEFPITRGLGIPNVLWNQQPIKGYPLGLSTSANAGIIRLIGANEVYFRWDADVLRLQAGRQSRHWGLGLVYNDGFNNPYANFKSVVDAALLVLPFGELEIQGGIFKNAEAFFNTEAEDITHLYAHAYHKQEVSQLETGIFFEYVMMGDRANQGLCGVGPAPAARNRGAAFFMVDGYGILHASNNIVLSAEVAYVDGQNPMTPCAKTTWDALSSFAFLASTAFNFPVVSFGVSGGFLQGNANGATDNKNSAFIFSSPNIQLGRLFHRVGMGLNTAANPTALYPFDAKAGFNTAGTGLVYAMPYVDIHFATAWLLNIQIPLLWTHVKGPVFGGSRGTFMGAEMDITLTHSWDKQLNTSLYLSGLLPGNFFQVGGRNPTFGYGFGLLASLQF
jgi:hypothetical protein